MKVKECILVCSVLVWTNAADLATTNTQYLVDSYEQKNNASKVQQKEDRRTMNSWSDEYQVMRLDVSVQYRMQMVKHQEHSFRGNGNVKWMNCLSVHAKEIRRSKDYYHENELQCLRNCAASDHEKKDNVEQLEKQIANWRKAYRYLVSLCQNENPINEEKAQECLIHYMQTDKYDQVIGRLMVLKQAAMSDLYIYYNSSLFELEECLKTQLSRYLDRVRVIMGALNRCYSISS